MDTTTREQELKESNRRLALDTAFRVLRETKYSNQELAVDTLIDESRKIESYLNEDINKS
jgi:hypothetical protein